jgi:4a-hydroxytetrahydrobiopterin dehydratase
MTEAALSDLPGWEQIGPELRKTYKLRDFRAAIAFVNSVAKIAENAQHHPDIDIRWNRVTLALSTHSAGALTSRDFDVARQIEASYTTEHG